MLSRISRRLALSHGRTVLGDLRGVSTGFSSVAKSGRFFSTEAEEQVNVCFLDPEEVVQPTDSVHEGHSPMVKCPIPKSFVETLKRGAHELRMPSQAEGYGEKDSMVNAWVFGDQVEAFEYHMLGSHRTKSGYTCAILENDLEPMKRAQLTGGDSGGDAKFKGVKLKPEAFQHLAKLYFQKRGEEASLGPFLFFGKVEDSEKASGVHVYITADAPSAPTSTTSSGESEASTSMGGSMSKPGKVPGAKVVGLMVCQADRMTMGEY